jgi:YfiH family protein
MAAPGRAGNVIKPGMATAKMANIHKIEGFFPPGVMAWQTTRQGGVSAAPFNQFNLATHVGDAPQAVIDNRRRLAQLVGGEPVWLDQVHGCGVLDIDRAMKGQETRGDTDIEPPTADAAFTSQAGPICAVMTADCLPVLIARGDGLQVAAAHAGWRGLCAGVIESTVQAMLAEGKKLGLPTPETLYFWLGPAIGQAAFEVGPEVYQAFVAQNSAAAKAFRPHDQADRWLASLPVLAQIRIHDMAAGAGLPEQGTQAEGWSGQVLIHDSGVCVHTQADEYFSYRRDRITGRMASLICRTTI